MNISYVLTAKSLASSSAPAGASCTSPQLARPHSATNNADFIPREFFKLPSSISPTGYYFLMRRRRRTTRTIHCDFLTPAHYPDWVIIGSTAAQYRRNGSPTQQRGAGGISTNPVVTILSACVNHALTHPPDRSAPLAPTHREYRF